MFGTAKSAIAPASFMLNERAAPIISLPSMVNLSSKPVLFSLLRKDSTKLKAISSGWLDGTPLHNNAFTRTKGIGIFAVRFTFPFIEAGISTTCLSSLPFFILPNVLSNRGITSSELKSPLNIKPMLFAT